MNRDESQEMEEEVRVILTSQPSPKGKSSSSRRGSGFANTLLRPRTTNLLSAIIAAVVLGICGILLFSGYSSLRDSQNAAIQREADKGRIETLQRSYDTEVRLYDKKVQDYQACLDFAETRVEGRAALRDALFHLVDGFVQALNAVLPGNEIVAQFGDIFTEDQHSYINENYAMLNLESLRELCIPAGPEPVKPPELQ